MGPGAFFKIHSTKHVFLHQTSNYRTVSIIAAARLTMVGNQISLPLPCCIKVALLCDGNRCGICMCSPRIVLRQ
ncbi:BQ5605_C001g00133 [Microbotryum silenes-dioicae]|uniref:BQ5605_C001g00133 protein n=1 Tax=Microbotryum silenes-dioicae TaxID=796604 RepID=A0A2X0M2C5_9BASI|nr:BQ5605_C001g00133 [Microbotryum silenes-dioicae]